jgi:inner membrane protein
LPLAGAGVAATLTLAAGFWFWCCRRMRAEHRALASLVGSLVVLFTFVVAGRSARARLLESPALAKTSRLETVLTPAPSNPLCWSAITVGERDARYELRVAALSLAPSLFAPEACRFQPSGQSLPEGVERFARGGADRGELSGAAAVDTPPGLRWELAWSAPLSELRSLFHTNCQARAFLRYARVPFWFSQAPAEVYLGDLRYDRAPEPEFTELSVPANPVTCPRFVPPWRPPRHDLLDAR